MWVISPGEFETFNYRLMTHFLGKLWRGFVPEMCCFFLIWGLLQVNPLSTITIPRSHWHLLEAYMEVSWNAGTPKSSHFDGIFLRKPSILGFPPFMETSHNRLLKRPVLRPSKPGSGIHRPPKPHVVGPQSGRKIWSYPNSKRAMDGWFHGRILLMDDVITRC